MNQFGDLMGGFATVLSPEMLLFAVIGKVDYVAGTAMGAGQLLGARFGSKMVMARGTKFIRPVFITVVLALTLKLLYDVYLKR